MAEHQEVDYVSLRPDTERLLFTDTLLAEIGVPFDRQTLAEGIGEVGLAGYYLHHDARHSAPPRLLKPILDSAHDIVSTTLIRHNQRASSPEADDGSALFFITDPDRLEAVADVTTTVMQRWTRTLWTQELGLLLPDRRTYAARGATEEDMVQEARAKSVILEVAAAVLEVWSVFTSGDTANSYQRRRIAEIVTGRGPDFLRKWMSRTILHSWLDLHDRSDEKEEWDAFADRTTLILALNEDIANPLGELQRLKQQRDSLSDEAIVSRSGWSLDRVRQDVPAGVRKKLATMYADVSVGLDRFVSRLDETTDTHLMEYTGWELARVQSFFSATDRRKFALERSEPVEAIVQAIARAHDFMEDTETLAATIGWGTGGITEYFNDTVRRTLAFRAKPPTKEQAAQASLDPLADIKAMAQTTAQRFVMLASPEKLAEALELTPEEAQQQVTPAVITRLALVTRNFPRALAKLRHDLVKVGDEALAKRLHISIEVAQAAIPWSLRHYCLSEYGRDPLKALELWWRGEKRLSGRGR